MLNKLHLLLTLSCAFALRVPTEQEISDPSCHVLYTADYGYNTYFYVDNWRQNDTSILINFEVLGPDNAHIRLSTEPKLNSKNKYEIVIGAGRNTFSTIRSRNPEVKVNTPQIMDKNNFTSHWVKLQKNVLTVGSQQDAVLSLEDDSLTQAKYVAFGAWTGVIIMWRFGCLESNKTEKYIDETTNFGKLKRALFEMYDPFAVPTSDYDVLIVDMGVEFHFIDLDEKNSQLVSHLKMNMEWLDPKLKWNPKHFGGVNSIDLFYRSMWLPDIKILNRYGDTVFMDYGGIKLFYNGTVRWSPKIKSSTWCKADVTDWPWDKHNCDLNIGLVSQPDQVHLALSSKESSRLYSTEWKILSIVGEKTITKDNGIPTNSNYSFVIHLSLERQSDSFVYIFVLPLTIILGLVIGAYFLPFLSTARMFLNSISLVLLVIFLLIEDQLLPALTDNTPKIIYLTSKLFFLLALQTAFLGGIKHLATLNSPPHRIILQILKHPASSFLIPNTMNSENGQYQQTDFSEPKNIEETYESQWKLFAMFLDRVIRIVVIVFVIPIEIALMIHT